MTLLELMIAMSVMLLVVGTMGGLARTVQQSYEYSEGYGTATQHARIVMDQIAGTVRQATANEKFPGCIVVADYDNSVRFPDTLVVWRPTGAPAAPNGLPRYNELVIYCPAPDTPNQFIELTVPGKTRTVPAANDAAGWRAAVAALKTEGQNNAIELTDQLRVCLTTNGNSRRGAARFEVRLRPSAADWAAYKASSTLWSDLPWVQGIYGTQAGMRQVWVRMELQLTPGSEWTASNSDGAAAVPYFNSASLYYQLPKQ